MAARLVSDVCARCGWFAPSSIVDPDRLGPDGLGASPSVAEGWATFVEERLIVDVPREGDFTLPEDVVEAIRRHVGPVRCERVGPEVVKATVREVDSHLIGLVCGVCQEETGWSTDEWFVWFALQAPAHEGEDA